MSSSFYRCFYKSLFPIFSLYLLFVYLFFCLTFSLFSPFLFLLSFCLNVIPTFCLYIGHVNSALIFTHAKTKPWQIILAEKKTENFWLNFQSERFRMLCQSEVYIKYKFWFTFFQLLNLVTEWVRQTYF